MIKRDLLTEAMADAKAVKETAIENAKAALTEAFAPHLKSMLAAKLQEMETEDDIEETLELTDPDTGEIVSSLPDEVEIDEAEQSTDDLDELLKEIEGEDELDEAKKDEESKKEETEEELNIEDMSEEDLIGFIEDVINDMIETGELEAGEPQEEIEDEEIEGEEEIDLNNLEDDEEQIDEDALADESVTDELAEAYKTIETLTTTINEVKLLNAKLLYTNKLFKEKTLTEGKKVQILHAFEKTKSVKEAKTTYEILKENLDDKKPVREPFKGAASKTMAPITENKQPIMEVDAQFARWQKIAGIKK